MNFKVMNRSNAVEYTYKEHQDTSVIISISCPWDNCPKFNFGYKPNGVKAILYLKFDDIDFDKSKGNYIVDGGYMVDKDMAKLYTCVTDEDARNIVGFITRWSYEVDTIIVHCDAGISRSSGCCAAIMKALTGEDAEIFSNPRYSPNMTVYHKCLKQFADAGYQGVYGKHYNEF